MAEPTIQLGGGNWAGKSGNLLGYYEQNKKFYAEDFTFSRSTTGTYTDSDGYIQEMPYNLLSYSEDLTNTWSRTDATVTSGQSGYDGTNNAWLFDVSVDGGNLRKNISVVGVNNFSVYAKKGTANGVRIRFDQNTDTNVYIDLTDGSIFTSANTLSVNVDSIGNGWYKINFSFEAVGLILFRIYTTDGTATRISGTIFLQSPQLVKGSSTKTYFPTTTRLNMPRVDYLNNSNGSLILEPQRSNLITYSEDFTNAAWVLFNGGTGVLPIVTSNYAISPDGTQNATRIQFSINGGTTTIDRSFIRYTSFASQTDYYYSCYVKSTSGQEQKLLWQHGGDSDEFTVTNEWQRVELNRNGNAETLAGFSLRGGISTVESADVLIWGFQVEQGSYPTSYIPTSGSSVTRNQDTCSITDVADRINSSEGVFYAEIAALANDGTNRMISLSDGTSDNRVLIKYDNISNRAEFFVIVSGVSQYSFITVFDNLLAYNKIALKYKVNDFALWFNGNKLDSNTSGNTFTADTLNNLSFDSGGGGSDFYGKVKQIQVYNTALTDSELATLTTL